MESIGTFADSRITPTEVQSAFTDLLDTQIVQVEEISDGVNTSCFLHTETEQYFVKFSTFHNPEHQFKGQPFILQYLTENTTVRVPDPIAYDYTKSTIPYSWYVTKAEDATVKYTDKSDRISINDAETVGQILGNINSVQTPTVGVSSLSDSTPQSSTKNDISPQLPFDTTASWSEVLKTYTLDHINTMDSRFTPLREDLLSVVESYDVRSITPHLLHCDFWWENLLWESSEQPIVIDWEKAMGGDPVLNQLLSEHYLFDRVAMHSDVEFDNFIDSDYACDLCAAFRDAYQDAYTGTQSLAVSTETRAAYELFTYIRELRGFPYWWRNRSTAWREKRAEALRGCIEKYL